MTLAGFHHIAAYTALSQERLIPKPSDIRHAHDRSPTLNRRLLSAIGKEELKRNTVDSLNPTDLNVETLSMIANISDQVSFEKQLEIYITENGTDKYQSPEGNQGLSLYI